MIWRIDSLLLVESDLYKIIVNSWIIIKFKLGSIIDMVNYDSVISKTLT